MKLKILFIFLLFLFVTYGEWGLAQDGLIPITIVRVPRPNIVVAETCCKNGNSQVRIKLAGITPPLSQAKTTEQLQDYLRELIKKPGLSFGFALGHTEDETIWVGYIYSYCSCGEDEEELLIINEDIIREGLAEIDSETAGRNLVNHLLFLREQAQQEKKGLWAEKEFIQAKPSGSSDDDCPSCER